jgi:hypothetical protein
MNGRSISHRDVELATGPSRWDLTNQTLYKLCQEHPAHTDEQAILAKLNIIGRVYAVAIERRKHVELNETGEKYYVSRVLPAIMQSELDNWIAEAKSVDPCGEKAISVLLEVHKKTTNLFNEISRQNKRSLASKYLHFHVPQLFFIYDSRARAAIHKLRNTLHDVRSTTTGDKEYRIFVARCVCLTALCQSKFGVTLTPRALDNLLLAY